PTPDSHLADEKGHPINWDITPDGKTLYCVPMSTNQMCSYDLTQKGETLDGRSVGELVPGAKNTDCRALCVGPKGEAWAALTVPDKEIGQAQHIVSYRAGDKAPRDHGIVSVTNPDFTDFMKDAKPLPFHGGFMKTSGGKFTTKYVVLGICQARSGEVYTLALHPYTLLQIGTADLAK